MGGPLVAKPLPDPIRFLPDPIEVRSVLDSRVLVLGELAVVPAIIVEAARAYAESEEIRWCVRHNCDGVPRLGRPPTSCWKAEFTRHLDPADCEFTSARLILEKSS